MDFNFERKYDGGDWHPITREVAHRQLGIWYLDGGDRVIEEMETSARANAPEPSAITHTPQATYRATVAAEDEEE